MKVLVTQNHMDSLGGSETAAYTLTTELCNRGYDVDFFTRRQGIMSDRLRNICNVKKLNELDRAYDLILINHNTTASAVHSRGVKGFKIQTCHGTIPPEEQPFHGLDAYVAISQEVKAHLAKQYIPSTVIHNGIDCGRYSPNEDINDKPKYIFSLSQSREANDMIKKAAVELGCFFQYRDKNMNGVFDIVDELRRADIVFGLGRSAYEAMACGRAVFVFDIRHYMGNKGDGILTLDNIEYLLRNNCSGRSVAKAYTITDLITEIKDAYNKQLGLQMREYAIKNLNIKYQVDKYLDLFR